MAETRTNGPAVSIVVPIYRVEPYLHRCLDSVLAQDYSHWEAILVDDGSPDRCGEIADKYAAEDHRFHVIHQENRGLSAARNRGMAVASGKYLMFLDSDDWWPNPQLLSTLVAAAERGPWDIINFVSEKHSEEGVQRHHCYAFTDSTETIQDKMYRHQALEVVWDKLYRRSLWAGIQFPLGMIIEDYYVIPEIYARAKRICNLNIVGYAYNRFNANSIMNHNRILHYRSMITAAEHHLALMEQGILPHDVELMNVKKGELAHYALRILLYAAGGMAFPEETLQKSGEVLAQRHHYLKTGKERFLYRLRSFSPGLFGVYGRARMALRRRREKRKRRHRK